MAVARSSSGRVTKSQGERAILEAFLSIDNALCSIAFATHTNTAESIVMPFGIMTRVGGRYHVLDGGPDPPRGRSNLGGCPGHSKALTIFAAAVRVSCKRDHSLVNNVKQQKGPFSIPGKRK